MDFTVLADHRVKLKEGEKRDKYLDLDKEFIEHESDGNTNCNECPQYCYQRTVTGTGGLGKRERGETIQTATLLRSTRILKRVLET